MGPGHESRGCHAPYEQIVTKGKSRLIPLSFICLSVARQFPTFVYTVGDSGKGDDFGGG